MGSDQISHIKVQVIHMTTIRIVSGELVVMPNSVLFKNPVEVLTSQRKRRVTIIMICCGRFAELYDRAWLFIIEGGGQKKRGDQCA